jgi:hypothetical protein
MSETAAVSRFTERWQWSREGHPRTSHPNERTTQTDAKATDNIRVVAAACRSEWGDKILLALWRRVTAAVPFFGQDFSAPSLLIRMGVFRSPGRYSGRR